MRYLLVLVSLLCWGATMTLGAEQAQSEYQDPTDEQIMAVSESPVLITNLLMGASTEKASATVVKVVDQIDQMPIPDEEKQARVGMLMAAVQSSLGEQSPPVMQQVIPSIKPNLLPPVAVGGPAPIGTLGLPIALPLAPPVAPRYPGQ